MIRKEITYQNQDKAIEYLNDLFYKERVSKIIEIIKEYIMPYRVISNILYNVTKYYRNVINSHSNSRQILVTLIYNQKVSTILIDQYYSVFVEIDKRLIADILRVQQLEISFLTRMMKEFVYDDYLLIPIILYQPNLSFFLMKKYKNNIKWSIMRNQKTVKNIIKHDPNINQKYNILMLLNLS